MVRGWARGRLRAAQTRSRGDVEVSSGPGDGRGAFGSRRSGVPDRDDAPLAPLKVSAAVSREKGFSGPWEPSVLCEPRAARQPVCDGGNRSRGVDWHAQIRHRVRRLRSRVAQGRGKTLRADLACTPRSHSRHIIWHPPITTTTHQPKTYRQPSTHQLDQRPNTRPKRPHTESHHHHDRNP